MSNKSTKMKAMSLIAAFAVAVAGSGHFLNFDVTAASVSDLQNQYNQLEQQQRQIQDKMKQTQSDQAKEEEYQKQLDAQIDVTQDQINLLNRQITAINEELAKTEKSISDKSAELEKTYDQFEQRMRAMYMSSDPSMLSILLESKGIGDFLSRVEMVKRVSQHDQELIDSLNKQKTALEQEKSKAQQEKKELEASQASIQAKQTQLNAAYEKSEKAELNLQKMEEQYKANKAKLDAAMEQAEREIQAAIQASQGGSGGSGDSPYVGGEFIWPVPGYYNITSGFGSRWGTTHKGIDISSGGIYGKNIVASNSGRVIKVVTNDIPGYSYGKYVMIDHGGGKVTLYGHCSAILVSVGQQVSQGEAIARVGNTGQSTGPHCHFEVRINGVAKNPLNYLTRR